MVQSPKGLGQEHRWIDQRWAERGVGVGNRCVQMQTCLRVDAATN